MMILFHATPLESTDGERLGKIARCKHDSLCVNPTHICIVAKELDLFLSNYLPQKGMTLFLISMGESVFNYINACIV